MNASQLESKEFQVRGYMVKACADYLREVAGEQESKRIYDGFSKPVREMIETAKPAVFYPVSTLSDVLVALAAQAHGDAEKAKQLLMTGGSRMALEATNSFLRLLMRMLTPTLLAKKIPDLWNRDCTGGRLSMDVGERTVTCHIRDTVGFAHALCTITGFIGFVLQTMGKNIETTTVRGWSLDQPHSKEGACEFTWK
jgi:hypothetical protein